MTARKKRPARDGATPEKIKSGRKTGKTPSKDRPYRAILRRWAFRPSLADIADTARTRRANAWRSFRTRHSLRSRGTSTDQCKSLPVVWITVHGHRKVTTCP